MEKKNSKSALAIISLVLGIMAIGGSFIPIINNASIVFGFIGAILAIVALIKKKSKGMAIAGLILCVLSIVISFSLQDSWTKSLDESVKDMDGSNTDKILKNDVDVKLGDLKVTTDEYGLTNSELVVTVTNKSNEKESYSIHLEAVDEAGKRIQDDYVYANDLAAGQTQDFKTFEYIEDDKVEAMKKATIKIVDISK